MCRFYGAVPPHQEVEDLVAYQGFAEALIVSGLPGNVIVKRTERVLGRMITLRRVLDILDQE